MALTRSVFCSVVLFVVTAELLAQHPDPGEMACTDCHGETMQQNVVHQAALEEMCTLCHQYLPKGGKMKFVSEEAPLCVSCHQNPAAEGSLYHPGADKGCAICHNLHGTGRQYELRDGPAPFNHFKSRFPLMGRHGEIKCLQCHPLNSSIRSGRAPFVCQDCHEERHRSSYQECGRCHNSQEWRIRDW